MRIWLALVGSIIYLFILLQLQTPDIGGQGTTSEVVQSVMKIIQSKGQLTAELWAVCTHHQRVCGCGQELTITEDARLFSIITGERMVSFVFSPSERTNPLTNLFRTCRHVHTYTIYFVQLPDSSHHIRRSYFLSGSFSWKTNTQHQSKIIMTPEIYTHLAMWLQIFIF